MEPNESMHQDANSGKPTKAQVADLKETIVTGMNILKDAAGEKANDRKSVETYQAALDALDAICEQSLDGDMEAFSKLRDVAAKSLQSFGRLDARGQASKQPRTSKRKAHRMRTKKASLPEHPVAPVEMPDEMPRISFSEITAFLDARYAFLTARADYERRRAELVHKLQMHCEPEDQSRTAHYLLTLDHDGDTICICDQSSIPAESIIDRR